MSIGEPSTDMQQRETDALAKGRQERSAVRSNDSTSAEGGGGAGSHQGDESKKTACPIPNLPLVTAARGSTCIQCRTAKVRCDKALPSCSRCVRRGERCERREVLGSAKGPVPLKSDGTSILRQAVRDTASFFAQYARLLTVAVERLHSGGGVDRVRAVNTIRLWMQANEACEGFDTTWGMLGSVRECLAITDEDVATTAGPDHASLGDLKRRIEHEGSLEVDFQAVLRGRGVDVGMLVCVCALEGRQALWMSDAAGQLLHGLGDINATVESERCLLLFLLSIYCAPSDQEDVVDAYARHLFGRELSTTSIIMMLSRDGKPSLRLLRLRYTAFPQCQSVYTVLTLEEVPPSRHMTRLVRARDSIIDHFRSSNPEAMDEGMDDSASASPSSLPSHSLSGSSLTGGGGRGEGGGLAPTWPLTTLGQPFDQQRMAALVQAERGAPQLLTAMFEPVERMSDSTVASGEGKDAEGQGGAAMWPPWVGEDRIDDLTVKEEGQEDEEDEAESAMQEGAGGEDDM